MVYPSSDGLPMAETDFQRRPLMYAVDALDVYFQDREDIYVSGNLFIYYEEGNPKAVVAPDVFVVIGTGKYDRSSYFLWREPKGPDFVIEITSRSTRSEDQGPKRGTYAFLGVAEYWQYDPTGDYLEPSLQGFQLVDRNYEPIPAMPLPEMGLSLHSRVLNLDLRLEQGRLYFYDPVTRQPLRSLREAEQDRQAAEAASQEAEMARQEAEEQTRRETAARQAAEARIAELEARLRALE
jgi:Uma2 family endonuclease